MLIGIRASQDSLLKAIADGSDLVVISVGYRLAPENPYPRPLHDCLDVAEWLVDNAKSLFGAELKFIGGEVSRPRLEACYRIADARTVCRRASLPAHRLSPTQVQAKLPIYRSRTPLRRLRSILPTISAHLFQAADTGYDYNATLL